MVKTLRPSLEVFKRAGWHPATQEIYDNFLDDVSVNAFRSMKIGDDNLIPSVLAFKKFVIAHPTVYEEFVRMFEQIDKTDKKAHTGPVNFDDFLHTVSKIFTSAPYYGDLGPPMYMIMARIMNTQGGFSAFTKELLNEQFKKMFVAWTVYLSSAASTSVLTEQDPVPGTKYHGWLSKTAKDQLVAYFPIDVTKPRRTFEEVFICEPVGTLHQGFTSFDDFFNRRFRHVNVDRPIATGIDPKTGKPFDPPYTDPSIVGAPCEADTYNVQHHVKLMDDLFIKDEAYSLTQLLMEDEDIQQFVGGTVVQGFLSTTGYHRWHSPVNGTIKRIVNVAGSYFNQAPNTLGSLIPANGMPPYLHSLRYFSHTNTRQLFFIEADNPDIGLVCFIAIGMTEISTCQNTVYETQHVNRGDELGMFHFGGSSFAMAFNEKASENLNFFVEVAAEGDTQKTVKGPNGVEKVKGHIYINEQLAKLKNT